MMQDAQAVQSCLAHCQATASDLKTLSNTVTNPQAKSSLSQAVQSIDACIKQCQTALSQLQQ